MFKIAATVFILCLLTTAGFAQIPTSGNVFFGYSYLSADLVSGSRTNLNGWNGSVEVKVFPFVGMVGDFSGHYGSQSVGPIGVCTGIIGLPCPVSPTSIDLRQHNFLFGPRLSVSVSKFRPFAHILIGAGHISGSALGLSTSDTSFAYAVGGGLDYHLVPLVGWRVQADMLQTRFFSNTQNNVRISTGLVIHF